MNEGYRRAKQTREILPQIELGRLSSAVDERREHLTSERLRPYIKPGEQESFEQTLFALREEIAGIEATAQHLGDSSVTLEDGEFDSTYDALETRVDLALHQLLGYTKLPYWRKQEFPFPSFEPKRDIRHATAREFLEENALQWRVGKEDIARFLNIASQTHAERVRKGEIAVDSPVEILDIGGANGAMAALIQEVSSECSLATNITIVDPDQAIMHAAQNIYGQEFSFRAVDADHFLDEVYVDQPHMLQLIQERRQLIRDYTKKYQDCGALHSHYFRWEGTKKIQPDAQQLREYTQLLVEMGVITTTDIEGKDDQTLIDFLHESESNEYAAIPERYLQNAIRVVAEHTRSVENYMLQLPTHYDLVINSWMPQGIDFTASVRLVNGAAIAYAFARDGSTGIQVSDNVHLRGSSLTRENRIGEERSYNPGVSYTTDSGWVSSAVKNPIPLANGVLIEIRQGFTASLAHGETLTRPTTSDYPWSEGLPRTKPVRISVEGSADKFDFQGLF